MQQYDHNDYNCEVFKIEKLILAHPDKKFPTFYKT
jgi:hypothetical protein